MPIDLSVQVSDRRLQRARDYVVDQRREPLTLAQVATIAAMSPYHLQRSFKAAFGLSPHEFLTQLKLEDARAALSSRSTPVTDLCAELGYGSLSTFSRWFKAHTGVSPLEYRRAVRLVVLPPPAGASAPPPQCFGMILSGVLPIARSDKQTSMQPFKLSKDTTLGRPT